MQMLEELSMNAVPALQTLLYDGWILRFAEGYGNRANSVNPLYQSRHNINNKIDNCEKIFYSRSLNPTFKITPFNLPNNLDEVLMNRRYSIIHLTSVQTLKLDKFEEPIIKSISMTHKFDENWYYYYCNFNNMSGKNKIIYKKMLENLITSKYYILLLVDNEVVACGLFVIENNFAGIFDIVVKEDYRKKGYGRQLMLNILKYSNSNNTKFAYLQVLIDNVAALNLYSKLGFREAYKYYYRVLGR
ncbi:MAG: GNAT family N-acetyltransferase [Clostridiales bacterium]